MVMSCNLAISTAYSYSLFQYAVVRYSVNSDLVAETSSKAKERSRLEHCSLSEHCFVHVRIRSNVIKEMRNENECNWWYKPCASMALLTFCDSATSSTVSKIESKVRHTAFTAA